MDRLFVICDSQTSQSSLQSHCCFPRKPQSTPTLWLQVFQFQHHLLIPTHTLCSHFGSEPNVSVDSLSELTDEPLCDVQTWKTEQKKNYIKNIIFVILDFRCNGGRRSTQIIKPTPKNENSIIFLLTSMWIGSCTTPTITYMFWCLNDSCSPKVLDSVQQIASDGCNSSKSFRASLTVEVPST